MILLKDTHILFLPPNLLIFIVIPIWRRRDVQMRLWFKQRIINGVSGVIIHPDILRKIRHNAGSIIGHDTGLVHHEMVGCRIGESSKDFRILPNHIIVNIGQHANRIISAYGRKNSFDFRIAECIHPILSPGFRMLIDIFKTLERVWHHQNPKTVIALQTFLCYMQFVNRSSFP